MLRWPRRLWWIAAWFAALGVGAAEDAMIGKKAPDWSGVEWVNSEPIQLPQLAGKVVLIRWWTAPSCPYCRATAPALNEFHREFSQRGLQVLGFYHHKSPEPLTRDKVKAYARRYDFEFPIGIDAGWRTLKEWWLQTGAEKWTSVSFLLDRRGVVRYIHPGGQYVKGDDDYRVMRAQIEALLAEK